ncbi:penicillin-binding protein activator [Thiomicrorhabdus sp. 6S3-12]|uniref:penicillin-binding protein activator n=1 Tax=Thiomicrorhabdus sp. 6S3-12 TaxID=2819681 RepID=UPI001AAC6174|nr:penicillin-binding protein activator [Thiomicrorhabdus sp. 6S3-12]MBO1924484.1 penicillin-binding protein activator [Thiomicrorhabdus sp. 6S3-12]
MMNLKRKSWLLALSLSLSYSSATFAFSFGELFGFGSDASSEKKSQQSEAKAEQSSEAMQSQLEQIDQEILILRAELAIKNGDIKSLRRYVEQLESAGVLPIYEARVEQLKRYLKREKGMPSLFEFLGLQGSSFEFDLQNPDATIALVLPMSGDYRRAGTRILQGMEQALQRLGYKGQLVRFDTEEYGSLFSLWERLKHYQPDLIIGPLKKLNIEAWHDLQTGIPTLYLNDAPLHYFSNEKSLSPGRSGGLSKLVNHIHENFHRGALVLVKDGDKAMGLVDEFAALNAQSANPVPFDTQIVEKSLDDSIEEGLGIRESKTRATVLRKQIRRSIEYVPRSRKDFDVVVSLLPSKDAVQVSPFLDLYQLSDTRHLWFSPQAPKLTDLSLYQTSWQKTYAFLPAYLYDAYQQSVNFRPEAETGIFYALGTAAIEILTLSEQFDQQNWLINTSVGQVETRLSGQFYLLPSVYLLDAAKVTPVVTD